MIDCSKTENYFEIETPHFYFDVYKAWNAKGQAMFRAGSYIKKGGGKKYCIDHALFAEWDYKDRKAAFEAGKQWVIEHVTTLSDELKCWNQPVEDNR